MNKDQLLSEWNALRKSRQSELLESLTDANAKAVMDEALLISQLNQVVRDAIQKLP